MDSVVFVKLEVYTLINGDSTVYIKEFDDLNKMLAGTSTEYNVNSSIDVSTMENLKNNADQLYKEL